MGEPRLCAGPFTRSLCAQGIQFRDGLCERHVGQVRRHRPDEPQQRTADEATGRHHSRPSVGRPVTARPRSATMGLSRHTMEELMDEAELTRALLNINERATTGLGNALVSAVLLGPLLQSLVQNNALSKEVAIGLIDRGLLALETFRQSENLEDMKAFDVARTALEQLLQRLQPIPPR